MRTAIALSLALLITGCASVPVTSLEDDAQAKTFAVKPNTSSIYLYRNETYGAAIPITVSLDGRVAGQTSAKTYFLWNVAPGAHEVSSHAESPSSLKINTEPGKAYYIWQEIKMGMWTPRTLLQQVDEQTGRAGVMESKRAQSPF